VYVKGKGSIMAPSAIVMRMVEILFLDACMARTVDCWKKKKKKPLCAS
jgi:hypothetical protein